MVTRKTIELGGPTIFKFDTYSLVDVIEISYYKSYELQLKRILFMLFVDFDNGNTVDGISTVVVKINKWHKKFIKNNQKFRYNIITD